MQIKKHKPRRQNTRGLVWLYDLKVNNIFVVVTVLIAGYNRKMLHGLTVKLSKLKLIQISFVNQMFDK